MGIFDKFSKSKKLEQLDSLGEVKGRRIDDLTAVLGDPWLRKSIDERTVQFTWEFGKVMITASWDKMDKDKIVSFVRSDRLK